MARIIYDEANVSLSMPKRTLHEHVLAGAQCGQCDHQFGQVAQRGVEQPDDRIAVLAAAGSVA